MRRFLVSLPERILRSLVALAGGAVHETAQLVLPRLVRRSRFYEATAKNLLRVAIELVGRVEGSPTVEETAPKELALRKGAGNVVELGSIAAFGFSPLWLLAGASDIARGSRVYLEELVGELKQADVLGDQVRDRVGRRAARRARARRGPNGAPDRHPAARARRVADVARRTAGRGRLAADSAGARSLFRALQDEARRENRTLLEVSSGLGLAFLTSARNVGREQLVVPWVEDWEPLRREGFGDYARRVSSPYRNAVTGHFDPARETHTERALEKLGG